MWAADESLPPSRFYDHDSHAITLKSGGQQKAMVPLKLRSALPVLACALALAAPALAAPAAARENRPVVVELFTAQGCAACPDANQNIVRLADDPQVIVLTYGVDYWDYLGWRDTFAQPDFVERQRAYLQAQGQRNLVTPQIIIQGGKAMNAAQGIGADQIMEMGRQSDDPPQIEFRETGDRVGVGSGRVPEGGAEVVAVRYTPGLRTVQVRAGDNRGRAVSHINVVRNVKRLGDWTGRSALYALPVDVRQGTDNGDTILVMLQSKVDRRILAAAPFPEPRRD